MAETERPQIIIEKDADPAIARRIGAIDRAIERNPEAFTAAMTGLGEQATASVIELSDMEQRIPTATRKPDMLIKEYLGNRYDLNSEFDAVTEDALAEDSTYQSLVEDVRNKRSVTVKKGQMSSEVRANPEADDARDALRRYRFAFYLSRVLAYKKQESRWEPAV